MNRKKRTTVRCTNLQIRLLTQYMAANPDLLTGTLTAELVARKEAKMNKLRKILKRYGPDKSIEQWKHTWRDLVRKNRIKQENSFVDQESEIIAKALENAQNFDFCDEDRWAANKLWIHPDDKPRQVITDSNTIKHEVDDPLFEGVEYLDTEDYLDHDLNHETQNNQEHETVTPDTSVSTTNNRQIVLKPLKINPVRSDHDSYAQVPSPSSSRSTLPSPEPPPSKKQKQTDNDDHDEVRETYHSGQCDRDIDVLNTLNKFIEYEKEKDKLQHEREMTRIKQADKLLNVMDKIANVFVGLAPSIKRFLERDEDDHGDDR